MTGLECIIPLVVLGVLLAGAQIANGVGSSDAEIVANESAANGCLVLLIIVAALALATLLVLAGAGAGMAR